MPLYVTLFIMYIHPYYFSGIDDHTKFWLPISVGYSTIFFPLFSIFLLKQLGFTNSYFLKTQKDRIIPYILCQLFYFWIFWVCKNFTPSLPPVITSFMLGVLLSASVALMANIYYKISMHSIGMGGLIGIFLVIMNSNTMLMTWPLCIALLATGLVCSSRLLVSDHTNKEIYMGLLAGLVCQLVAAFVIS